MSISGHVAISVPRASGTTVLALTTVWTSMLISYPKSITQYLFQWLPLALPPRRLVPQLVMRFKVSNYEKNTPTVTSITTAGGNFWNFKYWNHTTILTSIATASICLSKIGFWLSGIYVIQCFGSRREIGLVFEEIQPTYSGNVFYCTKLLAYSWDYEFMHLNNVAMLAG